MTRNIARERPLRLWPGVVLATLVVALRFVLPNLSENGTATMIGVLGGVVAGLAVFVWWAFFSRAPLAERLGGSALIVVTLFVTYTVLDPSIATGMMGMMFPLYAIPVLGVVLVVWAVATGRLPDRTRRATMVVTILVACGVWAMLRTEGVTGEGDAQLKWRWSLTAEEQLLARAAEGPAALPRDAAAPRPAPVPESETEPDAGEAPELVSEAAASESDTAEEPDAQPTDEPPASLPDAGATVAAEWPGFRGPRRDGVARGARVGTDWAALPPVELWRRSVGPGWSSFAVSGGRFYTQEQRGDFEVVSCYEMSSGEPVWAHRDEARFWESNGGAGPRATPTLGHGRVYTLGATGILNALDADNGAVIWSRNAASDTGIEVPPWGIAGSPVVVDDLVVVATAGVLAAYDARSGVPRWSGEPGGWGYSSPHLVTVDGVQQIVLLNGAGVVGVDPADGTRLWEHEWPGDGIVQPGFTAEGDILIGAGSGMGPNAAAGMRRIAVGKAPGGWTTEERWTTNGLKPYFNDFVVHEGHAYGVDGRLLSSIDLASGERNWKGGRYGHGQLILLPEQDLLLVLTEQGELALVGASPEQFTEVAKAPAIEGKTWNHPVLVGNVLLVRNDREMAAFRLPPPGS